MRQSQNQKAISGKAKREEGLGNAWLRLAWGGGFNMNCTFLFAPSAHPIIESPVDAAESGCQSSERWRIAGWVVSFAFGQQVQHV
jgi:hypothetical protein